MSDGFCYQEQMPLEKLEKYINDNAKTFIEYRVYYPDSFLAIYDFNFPVRIYFEARYTNEEIDVTDLINGKMLAREDCWLSEWSLELKCKNSLFPLATSIGRIEFVYPDDEAKFANNITEAKSYFEDYSLIRVAIGFGLFLSIATSYLIFSWLVHYVIYGARIGPKKKRPYQ